MMKQKGMKGDEKNKKRFHWAKVGSKRVEQYYDGLAGFYTPPVNVKK